MFSLKHNFIFVHIPKTGGNSIQNILMRYSEDRIVSVAPHHDGIERFQIRSSGLNLHKHSTLSDYQRELGEVRVRTMFKFTSVRNPWERMISLYFSPHSRRTSWDRDEFINVVTRATSIAHHVSLRKDPDVFNKVDYIIRFEQLNEDFKKVCELIGIPEAVLPVRNESRREYYAKYYDGELVEIVRNRFIHEIEHFHYEFIRSN